MVQLQIRIQMIAGVQKSRMVRILLWILIWIVDETRAILIRSRCHMILS